MAFTYTDTLATDRDKVRFWLQDTVENSGPKPADGIPDKHLPGTDWCAAGRGLAVLRDKTVG